MIIIKTPLKELKLARLKFGMLSYVNALPFYAPMRCIAAQSPMDITFGTPVSLNSALKTGDLDLSFISSVEYLQARESLVLLDDFCIGARERVSSVQLYLRDSITSLSGKTLALTSQSASSAAIVRLLCHHFWKIKPRFELLTDLGEMKWHEGFLLIGDDCLRQAEIPLFHSIDIAQAWYYATGLPFTFAVLAVRREIYESRAKEIDQAKQWLANSLRWSRSHWDTMIEFAAAMIALPFDTLRQYYALLKYDFNQEQKQGLECFSNLWATYVP